MHCCGILHCSNKILTQVLIYHGALDIICHFSGAQEMLSRTNWTGKDEFHQSERKALWLYNEVCIIKAAGLPPTSLLICF